MRKVIYLLFGIVLTITSIINMFTISNKEITRYGQLETRYAQAFSIPNTLTNKKTLYHALWATANQTHSNIYRSLLTSDKDQKNFTIKKYMLITNEDTPYLHAITIDHGQMLKRLSHCNNFVSTLVTKNPHQVGHIAHHMFHMNVSIYSLPKSFSDMNMDGLYYADLPANISMTAFRKTLIKEIRAQTGVNISFKDTKGQENTTNFTTHDFLIDRLLLFVFLILFILASLYYLFSQKREIAIMKIMGISPYTIWQNSFGKILLFGLVFLFLITTFHLGYFHDIPYAIQIIIPNLLLFGFTILLFIAIFALAHINFSFLFALKGKSFTNGILVVQLFAEALVILSILFGSTTLFGTIREAKSELTRLQAWDIASHYGLFPELLNGHEETAAAQMHNEYLIATSLYQYLNKHGALFINAKDFEATNLSLNRSLYQGQYDMKLIVNPNYLSTFPIYDANHHRVHISQRESAMVFLVPQKYAKYHQRIRKAYRNSIAPSKDYDQERYGFSAPISEDQKIKIIEIANDQKSPTLNRDVKQIEGVSNAVIQVITPQNAFIGDRVGILGGDTNSPLKVKLNGSQEQTYKALKPELTKLGLADNLTSLTSINAHLSALIAQDRYTVKNCTVLLFALIALLIYLIYHSTIMIFDARKKTYIIKKVFGLNFFYTYGPLCLIKGSIIVVITLIYSLVNPHYENILAMIFMLLIQTLVIYICILHLEKIKRINILKGVS
ncbi:MAG: hypothetical protein ACI32Q_03010 [Intestinibaculum porci]|uniref:hypothetical protein n=1 Tax=Intestinibaculum porci TaxID=2487118 RepID=UPI003F02FD08